MSRNTGNGTASVANGGAYDGLNGVSAEELATQGTLLDGSNTSGSPTTVSMVWRDRTLTKSPFAATDRQPCIPTEAMPLPSAVAVSIVNRDGYSIFADAETNMSLLYFHNALCWLLSALMLASTGISATYEHSHVGGDVAHEHQSHSHSHSTCSKSEDHAHSHHAEPSCIAAITSVISHVHVDWFGVELLLPSTDDPAHGDSDLPSVAVIVYTPLTQQFASMIDGQLAWDQIPLALAIQVYHDPDAILRDNLSSTIVTSQPLCDAARRERTGVLRC